METDHELTGVKNLSDGVFHNRHLSLSQTGSLLMRGSMKPYKISMTKVAIKTIIVMIRWTLR